MHLVIMKDGAVGVSNKLIPDCFFYWQLPPTSLPADLPKINSSLANTAEKL